MRDELVAIDLETTGLDPNNDLIIEIGAVRLKAGKITDEFSTLVNPGMPIPTHITHITGIRSEDVIGAPGISSVLPQIRDFAGQAPIIAHNISFDLGFLRPYGVLQDNLRIDTYELASVLLPRAPRYNLNSLTSELNIELEHAHRALDDTRATALLYWKLWEKVLSLPYTTLLEITNAAQGLDWDARAVFEAALRERSQNKEINQAEGATPALFEPLDDRSRPLRPNDALEPLDVDAVAQLVDDDGALAHAMADYERRPQQVEMIRIVSKTLNNGQHVMIEAGTGTGKSIAYLVPSILWATANNERVVISTNTINLQDQLIHKDIPDLQATLNVPFTSAVIKGRSNYLCPRRLAAIRRRRPTSVDELRTLAKILVWLLESNSGEKSDISLRGTVEHMTWQRLSAQDEGCTLERCRTMMHGACPFYKARKNAEAAHLLVVNHALLVSDAATDNRVLPDYRYLIIDEAHQLEDAVTNGMSFRIDKPTLQRRLSDLGTPSKGLLGDLLGSVEHAVPDKEFNRLRAFIGHISEATSAMSVHINALFKAAYNILADLKVIHPTEYVSQVLITDQHRSRASFAQLATSWATLDEFFEVIANAMAQLAKALDRLEKYDIPDYDDLINSTGAAARYLNEARSQLNAFINEPDANTIYWMTVGQNVDFLSFQTAPLHIGPLVEKNIWQQNEAVIMTSATLRTHDSFNYIRERLYAEDVDTYEVGSPFNYQESTLLYIPEDIPEPNHRHDYQQAVERGLIELAAALDGRVLGLFTSYAQLRQTAQAITPRLTLGNITVYDQSDGTSREALLEGFKSTEKAVLLGTKSFWEGVDIPGESLSALVIVRLPFAVPSEPIFAARSATYTDSFSDFALPDAILRFRQGFGRLIRRQTDRGIVTIFDSRILSKSYGAAFLEALPDCKIRYGSLSALPEAALAWLNRP